MSVAEQGSSSAGLANDKQGARTDTALQKVSPELLEVFRNIAAWGTYTQADIDVVSALIKNNDKRAYRKGYNSGWVAASRMKPEKVAYFAEQLELSAKNLREVETELKIATEVERPQQ